MRLTVFRYRVWNHQNGGQAQISTHYAILEYIEQIEGASVIEGDYLDVDESDLDAHGRIAAQ